MNIWCKKKDEFMSSFGVVRGENGQIKMTINNVKDYDIAGVGNITGSATFSVGNTGQKSNETVIEVGQTQDSAALLMNVDEDIDNIEFYGENIEARFADKKEKQYNVQMSAKNSTIDASKSNSSMIVNTHEKSENNTVILGSAKKNQDVLNNPDHIVIDSGKNNTFISAEDTNNYFQTTEKSNGAVILGGNGANQFDIAGNNAFVVGGKAADTFTTKAGSKGNVLVGMDGNDTFTDFGKGNLMAGGKGYDNITMNGDKALANFGFGEDYEVHYGGGASDNAAFAGESYQRQSTAGKNDITYYNYKDYLNNFLKENNTSMEEFMKKAGLSKAATVTEIINALKGTI